MNITTLPVKQNNIMNCSKEDFEKHVESPEAIFSIGSLENREEIFIGTLEQFKDCFFSNADYENIVDWIENDLGSKDLIYNAKIYISLW